MPVSIAAAITAVADNGAGIAKPCVALGFSRNRIRLAADGAGLAAGKRKRGAGTIAFHAPRIAASFSKRVRNRRLGMTASGATVAPMSQRLPAPF